MQTLKKWQMLLTLFLLIFIDSLNYFLIMPVLMRIFIHNTHHLLPITTPLATRENLYGIGVMLSPLLFLIFSPIIGNWSDQYGRKKIMLGCLLLAFLGYLLPVFGILQRNIIWVFIGRALTGAAMGSQPIAQAAVTDFTKGTQKAFYLAIIAFAMTLGMVIGPMAGSYLSDSHISTWLGISTPYYIGAALASLNVLLLCLFFHETHLPKEKIRTPFFESIKILFHILFKSSVSSLLFIFFFFEIAWSEYYQALFLYMPNVLGYSINEVGNFTFYIGLWMCFGLSFFYRWIITKLSIVAIFEISIYIMTGSLVVLSIFGGAPIQWIFVAPLAVFTGTAYAALLSLLSDHASSEHQGWVLGVASTFMGLTWMITAYTSSALMTIATQLPLWMAGAAMLFSCLLLLGNRQKFQS